MSHISKAKGVARQAYPRKKTSA